ncbi:Probable LRR receptor-like serine/threonine-protein kinase At3g47570, partial [Linum grandiflorum]
MSPLSSLLILSNLLLLSLTTSIYLLQANAATNNQTDQLALLQFKKAITSDPLQILRSWNDSVHFCNWLGVSCDQQQTRVTSLVLNSYNLVGTLSPHIGNLTFLQLIGLEKNHFRGTIPEEIGNLLHLQEFNLTINSFDGEIPLNLTNCSNLRILRLQNNFLKGTIPAKIGSLSKLEIVRFGTNNLTGEIPHSVGNLTKLIDFGAAYLNLVGTIPESLGNLKRLKSISLGLNQMTGKIPASFFNITSINIIAIPWNQFEGSLPVDIGFTLPNLEMFAISKNKFFGTIPDSFCNATKLNHINMNKNGFSGQIPNCLGNLPLLNSLSVGINRLGSNSTRDFDFLIGLRNCSLLEVLSITENNFGGILPNSIANLSVKLSILHVSGNDIIGLLPAGLQRYVNLTWIDFSFNRFEGSIPSYFSRFRNLQTLQLTGNQLSGQIPEFTNLTQLSELDISSNKLEGAIPASIGSCRQLIYLDVSRNKLTGAIPTQVFRLPSLTKLLNLSRNRFSGSLPSELGKLNNLNTLDISYNILTGEIPSSIGDCKGLEYLYLQSNSFDGILPPSLASLKGLRKLDLSFNHLRGQVPKDGIFSNATAISLTGNSKLCGGVSELHLPNCLTKASNQRRKFKTVMLITVVIASVVLFLMSLLGIRLIVKARRSKKKPTSLEDPRAHNFMRISYSDLYKATNRFSPDSLIGSGSFGSVFKGKLHDANDTLVAVKVLNLQQTKAYKSLAAECNALRSIRHRNLVKVVSYCSSLDHKGEEFKALVFEYMANGSLEKWLHPVDNLSLVQRLNIAVDVANALHYLHDLCETPVVHHDLNPSNVLLDGDMVAHVSDFGLAKFLSNTNATTSTIGVQGTVGYAAPEYGMASGASKEGDVYSFGIVVLEMFTGIRPTHEMFKDGLNIRDYVKAALPDRISSVISSSLVLPRELSRGNESEISEQAINLVRPLPEKVHRCLVSLLELGVTCSADSPQQRMKIADVVGKLHSVSDEFLQNRSRSVR